MAENEVLTGHFWHQTIKSDRLKWGMGQRAKPCQSQVVPTKLGCYWHAADTAPLEGLPILRCAIYDPLEGLQVSKMRLAEMGV